MPVAGAPLASSYATAPAGTAGYGNVAGPPSPAAVNQYGVPDAQHPQGGVAPTGDWAAFARQAGPPPGYTPPPLPTEQFMTPAMQQYVNQFQASQAQQQQAINAGLMQALQGLGSRRDAAAAVAATVPGAYQAAYNEATQNAATAAKNAGFGHPTIGSNADAQLIAQSNAAQLAAGKAGQPLLQAGITADYSKGATALENTKMQDQAAIAQQQQAFDQQMLQSQAQWQQQQAAAQQGYARDVNLARLNSSLGYQTWQAENPQGQETPEQQLLNQNAINAGFPSYAAQQQVQQSQAYNRAYNAITAGDAQVYDPNMKKGDITQVLKQLPPDVLKALRANGAISDAQMKSLYGQ